MHLSTETLHASIVQLDDVNVEPSEDHTDDLVQADSNSSTDLMHHSSNTIEAQAPLALGNRSIGNMDDVRDAGFN